MLAQYNVENLAPIIKRVFLDEVKFREGFNPDVIPMGRLMTMLGKHQRRNQVIANQIVDAAVAGRKSITMSHRLEQLDILKDYITAILKSRGMDLRITMGKYVGGMTQTALDNSATKDIILSTYTMASEGLDIPDLDTIFLATPMSSVLQSIGRILRACDEKKKPIVVDFIDKSIGLCVKMYKKRMKLYQSKGWK
jgi:superfamily II DNA or RNA helicase